MTSPNSTDCIDLDTLEWGQVRIDEDASVRWWANRPFDREFPFSTDVEVERATDRRPGDGARLSSTEEHRHD